MKNLNETLSKVSDREQKNLKNKLHGLKSPFLLASSNGGQDNLTLVSNVFHVGADPHLIGIVFRPDTVERHGLENIRKTKKFSLNLVGKDDIEKAHQTSARYPRDVSEFVACGLEKSMHEETPYVNGSKLVLFLDVVDEKLVEINGTHIIISKVNDILVDESFIKSGELKEDLLYDCAVSGLDEYYSIEKLFRLSYAKPNQKLKKV